MNRIEECEALATELGLYGTLEHIERLKDAKVLSAYKIMPTTMEEIERKVLSGFEYLLAPKYLCIGTGIGAFLGILSVSFFNFEECMFFATTGAAVGFTLMVAYRTNKVPVNVEFMPLATWKYGLPYGALLAIQEAKNLGLDDFQIAYPVKHKPILDKDPVIFSSKNGVLYEVFSWADGKIYE